ncbi:MAG: class I SAM-dependent methyltransferase [Desulfotignum sp.]|nr:class I SAM-dependent methyltransferase [Desulfotignum sp.]MCF8088684.1 class I SAM-dependent methyltransferase [Desulfotignum sp.]MCF8136414.1 class I SAM-dependent methyltransferase [Desulfotignum sp.]
MTKSKKRTWHQHQGLILETKNGFDVIDCSLCGFKHIVPIPTPEELEKTYKHEYYTREKPLYLERYREDLDWWNMVYDERYEILEKHLSPTRRRILDIGSGPGFFLLRGKERGWITKGIEPSNQAVLHSQELGLEIANDFFSKETAKKLGRFDAINMSLVLEHLPDPVHFLRIAYESLDEGGVLSSSVPNDFNPFQNVLRDTLEYEPWWVAPPHHINYFDFSSLRKLLERCGFEIVHQEASFPMDMFLLMGENYVGNDALGRECHEKRKRFEMNFIKAEFRELKQALYKNLSNLGLGREAIFFAKKKFY